MSKHLTAVTVNSFYMNIREILQLALLTNATRIIAIHNHPGGSLKPSHQDIEATWELKRACERMQIILWDHIIINSEGDLLSLRKKMKF